MKIIFENVIQILENETLNDRVPIIRERKANFS